MIEKNRERERPGPWLWGWCELTDRWASCPPPDSSRPTFLFFLFLFRWFKFRIVRFLALEAELRNRARERSKGVLFFSFLCCRRFFISRPREESFGEEIDWRLRFVWWELFWQAHSRRRFWVVPCSEQGSRFLAQGLIVSPVVIRCARLEWAQPNIFGLFINSMLYKWAGPD